MACVSASGNSTPHRRGVRGFTLPELVVVLAVTAILVSVAYPRFVEREGLQLKAQTEELRWLLRQAQRLALAKNRSVCVSLQANRLRLSLAPGTDPWGVCSVEAIGADGEPYALTAQGLSSVPSAFRFLPNGQPSPAPVSLTLASGYGVNVAAVTGHVD